MTSESEQHYTFDEALNVLGVDGDELKRMVSEGEMRAYRRLTERGFWGMGFEIEDIHEYKQKYLSDSVAGEADAHADSTMKPVSGDMRRSRVNENTSSSLGCIVTAAALALTGLAALAFWPTSQEENVPVEPTPAVAPAPAIMPQQEDGLMNAVEEAIVEIESVVVEPIPEPVVETPQPTPIEEVVVELPADGIESRTHYFTKLGSEDNPMYKLEIQTESKRMNLTIDGTKIEYVDTTGKSWEKSFVLGNPLEGLTGEEDNFLEIVYEMGKQEEPEMMGNMSFEEFKAMNEMQTREMYGKVREDGFVEKLLAEREELVALAERDPDIKEHLERQTEHIKREDEFLSVLEADGVDAQSSYDAFVKLMTTSQLEMMRMMTPNLDTLTLTADPIVVTTVGDELYIFTASKENDPEGNVNSAIRTIVDDQGRVVSEMRNSTDGARYEQIFTGTVDGEDIIFFGLQYVLREGYDSNGPMKNFPPRRSVSIDGITIDDKRMGEDRLSAYVRGLPPVNDDNITTITGATYNPDDNTIDVTLTETTPAGDVTETQLTSEPVEKREWKTNE
jgi:hypothetical protein